MKKMNQTYMVVLRFMCEQLDLCQCETQARHYSPEMISLSFLWYMTSKSAYLKLRELLLLPPIRRLQQLSEGTSVTTGVVHDSYLKYLFR